MTGAACGREFVKWFWTGPWLVTCRLARGHDGEHNEIPAQGVTT